MGNQEVKLVQTNQCSDNEIRNKFNNMANNFLDMNNNKKE